VRRENTSLRERGGSAAPDPVGEFWAWITGGWISVKDVGFGLPLFFALWIEMVSAFGPLGIVSNAEATQATSPLDMSRHDATGPDISRSVAPRPDHVVVPDTYRPCRSLHGRTNGRARNSLSGGASSSSPSRRLKMGS
jgi:hypothetical protein